MLDAFHPNRPPPETRTHLLATPFVPMLAAEIPKREWLYGHHLIRKNISVTLAPGGVGKSSLTILQALELASGQGVLGHAISEPARVWLFNLEDERHELVRRITAAMMRYDWSSNDIGNRLLVDTGREQELVIADQKRDCVVWNEDVLEQLERELLSKKIDVLIIDPFVSAHRVNEMDNGKVDMVVKRLLKLADICNCAIELVHHTRKLNGAEATSDASRGASSLVSAARSSRVLQRLSDDELQEAGIRQDGRTYFSVKRDKANLATSGRRETFRTTSIDLGQGDEVGVVEIWKKPGVFEGVTKTVKRKIFDEFAKRDYRLSDQAGEDWAGTVIATALGLDLSQSRKRIKRMINDWLEAGDLERIEKKMPNGKSSPFIRVPVVNLEE